MDKRIETLDAFRGIAASSVLLVHYTYGYRVHYGHAFNPNYDFKFGYLGVEFFFMISGFVIFLTLLNAKSAGNFIYKRMTRIYPTFLVCLILTFIIVFIFGLPMRQRSLYQALGNLFIAVNIFGFKPVDGVYWTLEIEIFFYFFMFILLLTNQVRYILIWGIVFLTLTWVNQFFFTFPSNLAIIINVKYNCLFFAGILFHRIKFNPRFNWKLHLLVLLCLLTSFLVLKLWQERVIVTAMFTIFYLFSYGKLSIHTKPLLFLGRISYPLYLIHQNVGYVILNQLKPMLGGNPIVFISVTTIIILILAFLIHRFIEKPSIRILRDLKFRSFPLSSRLRPR